MTRRILGLAFGVLLGFSLLAGVPVLRADDANQATQFTFNRPVEIPGNVVLPAGTYWFLIPNDVATPNIVYIFNADRTQLYTTLQTIPTTRATTSDDSELTFAEQSPKQPMALMSWFYPDRLSGHEFIYSPREESRFSESRQITVMAHPAAQVYAG
jgi:hypothetical protein